MSKIIVSGSDDTYFQVTLELIDSIRRHEDGRRLPIAIIDGGLTVDQKFALDRQGIHVVAPYVPAYVSKKELEKRRNLVVNVSKLWLNRLFSRYDTVLWIDADAWVQDFRAVELLFDAAATGHLAIVPEAGRFLIDQVPIRWIMPGFAQVRSFLYKNANHARLPWRVRRNLSTKAALNAGVFALKVNAPHSHQFPHPTPQNALRQIQVTRRLGNRYATLRNQLHSLSLELTAKLPSRHSHSPVLGSRSYRRVHQTGSSSMMPTVTWLSLIEHAEKHLKQHNPIA